MFYIYRDLFTDNACENNTKKILSYLKKGKALKNIYCIMYSTNEQNLFDILSVNNFLWKYYKNRDNYIIGFTTNKEEATKIIVKMIELMLSQSFPIDTSSIKSFYSKDKFIGI